MYEMGDKRLLYIDIARGIGILMVMYSHFMYNNSNVMVYISGCYIPLFFVISGYLAKTSNGWEGYFNRIKYLLGPYFFFSFVFCIIYSVMNKKLTMLNIIGVFYSRFFLYPNGIEPNVRLMEIWNSPMWFLTAMVVSLLIWKYLSSLRMKNALFMSIFLLICFFMMQKIPILLPWSVDTAPLFVLFILVGYRVKYWNLINRIHWIYYLLFLFVYVLICHFNGIVNLSIRDYGLMPIIILLSGILGSILIIRISICIESIPVVSGLLSLIGRNSTCVFCTHVFVFTILYKVIGFTVPSLHPYFLLIVNLTTASIVGVILSVILKKYLPFFFR